MPLGEYAMKQRTSYITINIIFREKSIIIDKIMSIFDLSENFLKYLLQSICWSKLTILWKIAIKWNSFCLSRARNFKPIQ
jgi:hypothetical protein